MLSLDLLAVREKRLLVDLESSSDDGGDNDDWGDSAVSMFFDDCVSVTEPRLSLFTPAKLHVPSRSQGAAQTGFRLKTFLPFSTA